MRNIACASLMALLLGSTAAVAASANDYRHDVTAYFANEWKVSPTDAVSLGVHDGDALLDDVSPAAHEAHARSLHDMQAKLRAIDASTLSPVDREDRDVLLARIDGQLLQLETIQGWRHNPALYVDLMTTAIYQLIERDFAPLKQRMASVIARETQIPSMLQQAKANLVAMPPVFIDVALENLDGADSFFGKDVPAAFEAITDPEAKKQLTASTKATLDAVASFKAFLLAEKPKANASFVLGRDTFQHLLATDLVNVPVERVLAAGRAQLARDRADFLGHRKETWDTECRL